MFKCYGGHPKAEGAYKPSTGVFKAKKNGVYFFSFYAWNDFNSGLGYGYIKLNGSQKDILKIT